MIDKDMFLNGTFPHCDPRVLHAPTECKYCDEYGAKAQELRIKERVAFTGHKPSEGMTACPSDAARGTGGAHVWGGNAPSPAINETSSEFYDRISREMEKAMREVAKSVERDQGLFRVSNAQNVPSWSFNVGSTTTTSWPQQASGAPCVDWGFSYPQELVKASAACDPGDEQWPVVSTPSDSLCDKTPTDILAVRHCYACDADTTALRSGVPVCVRCAG